MYFWRKLKLILRDFRIILINIKIFTPIILTFRDWDYSYTLNVLKVCLKEQRQAMLDCLYLKEDENGKDNRNAVAKIEEAISTIETIEKDPFIEEAHKILNTDEVNSELAHLAWDLEKKAWSSLFDNLKKNMRNWWT